MFYILQTHLLLLQAAMEVHIYPPPINGNACHYIGRLGVLIPYHEMLKYLSTKILRLVTGLCATEIRRAANVTTNVSQGFHLFERVAHRTWTAATTLNMLKISSREGHQQPGDYLLMFF